MARREKHWGTVIDNRDPEYRGRLVVQCDTIAEGDVLEWVDPSFHFVDSNEDVSAGSFWVPSVGTLVEVEIESEPDSEARGLDPRWKCCLYSAGQVPEEFIDLQHYPNRRGWKTRAGHLFFFDDTDDDQVIKILHANGAEVLLDDDGTIYVKQVSGQTIELGSGTPRESTIKGETRNTDLDVFLIAMNAFVEAVAVVPGQFPTCEIFQTAIATFQASLSGHLSDVVKVE